MGFVSYMEDIQKRLDDNIVHISTALNQAGATQNQNYYGTTLENIRKELSLLRQQLNEGDYVKIVHQLSKEQQYRAQLEISVDEGTRNQEILRGLNGKLQAKLNESLKTVEKLKLESAQQKSEINRLNEIIVKSTKQNPGDDSKKKDREIAYYVQRVLSLQGELRKAKSSNTQKK